MEKTTIETKIPEEYIIKVESNKLKRRYQPCMRHKPQTHEEYLLRGAITQFTKSGMEDFCVLKFVPSYEGKRIKFLPENKTVTDNSYFEWVRKTRRLPVDKSRVGTKLEFSAFLGTIIVLLVDMGYSESQAWYIVCNDPSKLVEIFNWWYFIGPIILSSDDEYDEFWVTREGSLINPFYGFNPKMNIKGIPFIAFKNI